MSTGGKLNALHIWNFSYWGGKRQYHDILIFWACLTGGPRLDALSKSSVVETQIFGAGKHPQAGKHYFEHCLDGVLGFLSSAMCVQWGAEFLIRVAAAVWLHAVAPNHFTCTRTQTQSGNSSMHCILLHKCSCSLTWIDTQRHIQYVPTDKYTCSMTCIYMCAHMHPLLRKFP